MDLIHTKSSSSRKIQNQLIMYRKVIENPYIRISIRRLKSKKRAKILGSRFAEAVPPAESLKESCSIPELEAEAGSTGLTHIGIFKLAEVYLN